MFVFTGRSVLPLLAHQAEVVRDPIYFHARGLSDHAPSFWKFSTRLKSKGRIQCLQHNWCRHPAYRKRMDALCNATDLSRLPVDSRSILLKSFIREASIHARDCMFEDLPNGHTSRLLRLSSIARTVWQKDLKLYNLLVSKSELARQHLVLVGGEPRLFDSNVFEEQFREAKVMAADGRRTEIKAEHSTGRLSGSEFDDSRRTARLNRNMALEKLWHPRAPALCVMGVKLSESEANVLDIGGPGLCLLAGSEGTFTSDDGFVNC